VLVRAQGQKRVLPDFPQYCGRTEASTGWHLVQAGCLDRISTRKSALWAAYRSTGYTADILEVSNIESWARNWSGDHNSGCGLKRTVRLHPTALFACYPPGDPPTRLESGTFSVASACVEQPPTGHAIDCARAQILAAQQPECHPVHRGLPVRPPALEASGVGACRGERQAVVRTFVRAESTELFNRVRHTRAVVHKKDWRFHAIDIEIWCMLQPRHLFCQKVPPPYGFRSALCCPGCPAAQT